MKHIAFILSIYILMLSIVPCTDGLICDGEHQTESSQDHPEHDDYCTPFCICSCCGIAFTVPTLKALPTIKNNLIPSFYFFNYSFSYSHEYLGKIWQPPTTS